MTTAATVVVVDEDILEHAHRASMEFVGTSPVMVTCKTILTMGLNDENQLGRESRGISTTSFRPVRLPITDNLICKIIATDTHALALTSKGVVLSWGTAKFGVLGKGVSMPCILTPFPIDHLTEPIQDITTCKTCSLAVSRSGHVWFWGKEFGSTRGSGSRAVCEIPKRLTCIKQKAVRVATNSKFALVVTADTGKLLIIDKLTGGPVPTMVSFDGSDNDIVVGVCACEIVVGWWTISGRGFFWFCDNSTTTSTICNNPILVRLQDPTAHVVNMSMGNNSIAVVTRDGRLFMRGTKADLLGRKERAHQARFTLLDELKLVKVVSVSCGLFFTAVVDDQGRIWTWGEGKPWEGDVTNLLRPRIVHGARGVQTVSCGSNFVVAVVGFREEHVGVDGVTKVEEGDDMWQPSALPPPLVDETLLEIVESSLLSQLTPGNVLQYWATAHDLELHRLAHACEFFVRGNLDTLCCLNARFVEFVKMSAVRVVEENVLSSPSPQGNVMRKKSTIKSPLVVAATMSLPPITEPLPLPTTPSIPPCERCELCNVEFHVADSASHFLGRRHRVALNREEAKKNVPVMVPVACPKKTGWDVGGVSRTPPPTLREIQQAEEKMQQEKMDALVHSGGGGPKTRGGKAWNKVPEQPHATLDNIVETEVIEKKFSPKPNALSGKSVWGRVAGQDTHIFPLRVLMLDEELNGRR